MTHPSALLQKKSRFQLPNSFRTERICMNALPSAPAHKEERYYQRDYEKAHMHHITQICSPLTFT